MKTAAQVVRTHAAVIHFNFGFKKRLDFFLRFSRFFSCFFGNPLVDGFEDLVCVQTVNHAGFREGFSLCGRAAQTEHALFHQSTGCIRIFSDDVPD